VINRAKILKDWIEQEGRKQSWVAQQANCSPQWLNYVLNGKKLMSDKLAEALQKKLGIPLNTRRALQNGTTEKTGARRRTRAKV